MRPYCSLRFAARSLTRGKLYLNADQPYVTCKAGSTKNHTEARQYIQTKLAEDLRTLIATKAPKAPVFDLPHETNVARMFREDLAAARRAMADRGEARSR